MSKFCGNCGATLDDNAAVCGYCGAPQNTGKPANQGINKAGVASIVKEVMSNKIVKIALPVVLAVVVILIVVFAIIVPNTGVNGAAKDLMKAYKKQDTETLLSMCSVIATEDGDDDAIERNEEYFDKHFENIDDEFGSDVKITCKINGEIQELSSGKLKDYQKIAEDDYDLNRDYIEEGYKTTIRVTYKDDDYEKSKSYKLLIFKENGEWKFYIPDYYEYVIPYPQED